MRAGPTGRWAVRAAVVGTLAVMGLAGVAVAVAVETPNTGATWAAPLMPDDGATWATAPELPRSFTSGATWA